MPQIQVLSDLLVNKIAAGEVIERPASVVKELVENSLDAGATRVEIAIEQGGRKLIRVTDNASGMDVDDLALAVRPHATSKIRDEEDLFGIHTMGFRGEALPSIGAVSQLRIVSRRPESESAHEVRVVADRIDAVTAAAGPVGTTVEVRELFFNVPARQKFLRTPQTEVGHITEQLARIALVYPRIEFRLTHNDRLVHHLRPAESMRSRIADFYGKDLADSLLEVRRDERGLKIDGYAAPPAHSRSSGKWQYLFLNGRFIRDRFVAHAVREAYRGLIDARRYPVVFVALEIDPSAVDVNVHPTKVEVRWRDSNAVYSQVLSALRDRFLNADLTPALESGEESESGSAGGAASGTSLPDDADMVDDRRRQIRQSVADFFKRATPGGGPPPGGPYPFSGSSGWSGGSPSTPGAPKAFDPGVPTRDDSPFAPAEPQDRGIFQTGDGGELAAPLDADNVIQVHRSYLVAETADGVMIIDQHALHERILFEQLAGQITKGPLESQRMLIPETVDVPPDQIGLIETHADTLAQLGFELNAFGPSAIAVQAAPTLLKPERVIAFLRDVLDRLSDRSAPASTEMLVNDLLSMMACKAAVKAGDPLSPEEIKSLIAQRHDADRSSNCPHGRPTSLRLTLKDLERQFKRT